MTLDPILTNATQDAIFDASERGRRMGWQAAIDHLSERCALNPLGPQADALIDLRKEAKADEIFRHIERWPLLSMVAARLVAGEVTHGSASLDRPIPTTIDEIVQEAADVVGWACVLERQLERLRVACAALPNVESDG